MKPFEFVLKIITAVIAVAIISSCANKEADKIMDAADAVMWTTPDSALAAMESIDTLTLSTTAQRARYSLLYTMALDRCYIDTTDLHVIRPAARYYERRGSNDDKMKMYYYLGVVQSNAGELESAIESYIQAREYSLRSENLMFRGLISSAISYVYMQNNNLNESIKHGKEACDYFLQAKDTFRLWNTTGYLANSYLNIGYWPKADSLYSVFFSQPIRDTSIYARQLLNVAFGNIFRPDGGNPQESINLFRRAVIEYGCKPYFQDYCIYAYASEMTGDQKTADDIIHRLECMDMDSTVLKICRYRILKHRGNYLDALTLLEQSIKERDSEVLITVGQSVALAQSDYYENKSVLLDKDRKIRNLILWIVSLVSVIIIAFAVWIYSMHKRKWQLQFEEMSSINEEVKRRLSEALLCESDHLRSIESLTSANKQAEEKIMTLSEKLTAVGREQMIANLRSKYVKANKRQYGQLNDLCHRYFESHQSSRGAKDKIYSEVKSILAILDEPNQKKLESMLDNNLDGIMTKFRAMLPDATEKDFRFISFCILGFDSKTIARITGYNVNTVYNKRYNLKEKILKMNCDDEDLFLELISC